jgi:hypothetical protein
MAVELFAFISSMPKFTMQRKMRIPIWRIIPLFLLLSIWTIILFFFLLFQAGLAHVSAAEPDVLSPAVTEFVTQYCVDCHNSEEKTADLSLEILSREKIAAHWEAWEQVVRRLRARQMPPPDARRPDEKTYQVVLAFLEQTLDERDAANLDPGRTDSFRRLTRNEYQNAIRDLLHLDIDAAALLPSDESSHGFDNITVADLSPTLLDRYISAALKISKLAVGGTQSVPQGETIRIRPDLTQEEHVDGLPLGTRGGALIPFTFPRDGEYDIDLRLTRDRNEEIEGLKESHELEVLLDRKCLHVFTVSPPKDNDYASVDNHLKVRITASAGPHQLGVTFRKSPSSLLETSRQPFHAHFNMHRHPRISPAIYQISIVGPVNSTGSGTTPSRERIFICRPQSPKDEDSCAEKILETLIRRAYRRPVTSEDLERPLAFYRAARQAGDFESGIESALSAVLVSPQFLFRIERDPPAIAAKTPYRISDLELASRLSFFLWSSIPDDELLGAASRGELARPEVLERQVLRMLGDSRSNALVRGFAGQWLHLRNLDSTTPDLRLFPEFDDNLRQAFREETELCVAEIVRENRNICDLLKADHTYLNERLAKHYGIDHIYGSQFRRVSLDAKSERGGLFRQGSILTVTSYANRTSPVLRGKWILDNIIGLPPPPPPENVPALRDNTVATNLSVRERLAEHRANAACASCHNLMDPVGFALENFDSVGRWRTVEEGKPVDASGALPDGRELVGVAGLERNLLDRPEIFVSTFSEKLLTYALGRVVDFTDAAAIRKIVRDASREDYRFSSLVQGIASSKPFQMRMSP